MNPTSNTLQLRRSLDVTNSLRRRALLRFCYSACRIDGECIGWLPAAAYDEAHLAGRLLALWNNDDLVGFLLWSCDGYELRILQIWIRRDARLLLHGRALIEGAEETARAEGAVRLRLWCAIDLAANLFWRALGFRYKCWRWGRAKKSRRHALWTRPLMPPIAELQARSAEQQLAPLDPSIPRRLLLPSNSGDRREWQPHREYATQRRAPAAAPR